MATPYRRISNLCKDAVGGLFSKYCEQIEPNISLSGKVAIVTGATTGIGLETARALAWRGAHVVLAGRKADRLSSAALKIRGEKPKNAIVNDIRLTELLIDLNSLASVRDFSKAFLALNLPLHLLVNNAGFLPSEAGKVTADGFDEAIGCNHLGHFYLTKLLENKLKEAAPSRIVILSSSAHFSGKLSADKIKEYFYPVAGIKPYNLYGNSKLCNALHARELARRFQGSRVTAYSVHPGMVKSEFLRDVIKNRVLATVLGWTFKNSNQGATTSLYVCLTPDLESENGNYFANCGIAESNPLSHDPNLASALWEASEFYINQFETGQLSNNKSD